MEKRFYPTKIIYFESFENFSIQLLKNVQIIKRLTDKIQNYVKNATIDNIEKLEVGKHCLVLILTINGKLWHRCVIESIDDGITVYLRDKGYSVKIIAEENIMSIPSEFDLIEDGAIKCSMFDVDVEDNHDSEIQQKLMRKVGKHVEQISMKIHDTCYDQRLSVTLWGKHKHLFAIGYTNINKIIKENGCEASFDIITNPNKFASTEDICERIKLQNDFIAIDFADKIDFKKIRVKIDSSKCENDRIYHYEMKEKDVIDWLPSEPIQMENFQAIATYVDRKCRIFVQEEKEIIEAEILSKKITDYIKEVYGKKKVKSYALEKGKPCFSMYADGQFYRGKIKRIIQADNCCVVRFIDYGNCLKIRFRDIFPANLFGDIPILSRKYAFAHIKPTMDEWQKEAIEYCKEILVNQPRILVKSIRSHESASSEIELCEIYLKGNVNAASKLVSFGFAEFNF